MSDDLKIALEAYRIAVIEEHNASQYSHSVRKPMPEKVTDEFRKKLSDSNQRFAKAHEIRDKAIGKLNRIIIEESKN